MNINLKATYNLSKEDVYALFFNSLCSGSIGYGECSLDTSSTAYAEAKDILKILKSKTPEEFVNFPSYDFIGNDYITSEDIWLQVLKMGKLVVLETDCDDFTQSTLIDFEESLENLEKMQESEPWILKEFAEGEDDGNTHDAFLQCFLLGEIIYG